MPYKSFAVGELATSADVNTYLMKQTVMVFADSTARAAAITSPAAGMVTYLTGTNALQTYNGSSWVNAVNTASIQNDAVTASAIATGAVGSDELASASVTAAKLSGMYGVTFTDAGLTMSTSAGWRTMTIPSGKNYSDIVSIVGLNGVNDIVYLYATALGNWSGVQLSTQVQLYCALGNAVASTTGTIRFYFRA